MAEDPREAAAEKRVPVHFTGSQVIELLTPQVQVLDYCQVTLFSKMLEDSVQGKMHHLPLGTRLHRSISMGGGKRPGDGCPGFLSKMGVTIFKGTQVCVGREKVCMLSHPDSITKVRPLPGCVHQHCIMVVSCKFVTRRSPRISRWKRPLVRFSSNLLLCWHC